MNGKVPEFFLVGHPKCGTTALFEALKRHPDVFMSAIKEPAYLAEELRCRPQWSSYGRLPRDLDGYLSLFEPARKDQRLGEASAWYLWSRSAAANMVEMQPDAKIIAIFREPASFLRSLHLQMVQAHIEPEKDLRRALELEDTRRRRLGVLPEAPSDWPQILPAVGGLIYSDYVRYMDQLKRYTDRLPPENLLVLTYDDFRRSNDQTIRTVLRFLQVDDEVSIAVGEANPSVRVRSRRLNDIVRSVYMGSGGIAGPIKSALKTAIPSRRLRRAALEKVQHQILYADPLPPDERLMEELRQRFEPEVLALGAWLGRDLASAWGY